MSDSCRFDNDDWRDLYKELEQSALKNDKVMRVAPRECVEVLVETLRYVPD